MRRHSLSGPSLQPSERPGWPGWPGWSGWSGWPGRGGWSGASSSSARLKIQSSARGTSPAVAASARAACSRVKPMHVICSTLASSTGAAAPLSAPGNTHTLFNSSLQRTRVGYKNFFNTVDNCIVNNNLYLLHQNEYYKTSRNELDMLTINVKLFSKTV